MKVNKQWALVPKSCGNKKCKKTLYFKKYTQDAHERLALETLVIRREPRCHVGLWTFYNSPETKFYDNHFPTRWLKVYVQLWWFPTSKVTLTGLLLAEKARCPSRCHISSWTQSHDAILKAACLLSTNALLNKDNVLRSLSPQFVLMSVTSLSFQKSILY